MEKAWRNAIDILRSRKPLGDTPVSESVVGGVAEEYRATNSDMRMVTQGALSIGETYGVGFARMD